VRRVSVVGTSGSGKSTLSRELARILDCPWLELDSVYHQANWTPLETGEFLRRVTAVAGQESWVIDGGYSAIRPVVLGRADTVVWLDLPKRVVMRRIIWRSVWRAARGAELWNGNRENWRNLLSRDPEKSIIAWAWHTYGSRREHYAAEAADPANGHLRFVRLTSPAAVRRLLREEAAAR
jgi:adenylate kinase family enzyme